VFWVISVHFNIRNTLPKSGTFLLGHPVYIYIYIYIYIYTHILHPYMHTLHTNTCIHPYITYMHTYITYVHDIHIYITHIHYKHTCTHTHMLTYIKQTLHTHTHTHTHTHSHNRCVRYNTQPQDITVHLTLSLSAVNITAITLPQHLDS